MSQGVECYSCLPKTAWPPTWVDQTLGLSYALDMTSLIVNPQKDPADFIQEVIQHFAQEVADRLKRIS